MGTFSFASSVSVLPREVREQLAQDVADWQGSGSSALELPFNDRAFGDIMAAAEYDLRVLLDLPSYYHVLFLQGGASAQFGLLPLNLVRRGEHCDYVDSGYWSRRAIEAAASTCCAEVIASGNGASLPSPSSWRRSSNAAYCHFTSNETAEGLQFHEFPEPNSVPLIADMTADFLTRPLPVERFGLIYASAQKNLGAAGLTIVVVRRDLLGRARPGTPAPFDYARQARALSKVNTPPTFAILVAARMLRWLRDSGGLEACMIRNKRKSERLYAAIDDSGFFYCPVAPADRSSVNVCFRAPNEELEELFLKAAEAEGLLHLRGHSKIGGLRASLYNAVPEEAVDALRSFMANFTSAYRRRRA